ncbi:MAG: discoidin domain-containing protein [Prevotellaceae bacterium]|nr:discoidin domain-containing protein [Prevotellaceae bacterium]
MKNLMIKSFISICCLTVILFAGCSDDEPEQIQVKKEVEAVLPDSIYVDVNETVIFVGKGFTEGDRLKFVSYTDGYWTFQPEITSIRDESLSFNLPNKFIYVGIYKIVLLRGDKVFPLGHTIFSLKSVPETYLSLPLEEDDVDQAAVNFRWSPVISPNTEYQLVFSLSDDLSSPVEVTTTEPYRPTYEAFSAVLDSLELPVGERTKIYWSVKVPDSIEIAMPAARSVHVRKLGLIDRTTISVSAVSSQYSVSEGGHALIDGNLYTWWHSAAGTNYPHWLILDLGRTYNVARIDMYRRMSPDLTDTKTVLFLIGDNPGYGDASWRNIGRVLYSNIQNDHRQILEIPEETDATGRYLQLYLPDGYRSVYTSLAEIYIYVQ